MRPFRFIPPLILLSLAVSRPVTAEFCEPWPLWSAFSGHFIQADGRVIDFHQPPGITTSEGQAYTLFFALVANDRRRFDVVLRWTRDQLANGSLEGRLPAWLWGRHESGGWRVLDSNTAADADMWLAYVLLEAGRLWGEDDYSRLGMTILHRIEQQEVAVLPGLGAMVIPGGHGFQLAPERWLLNPSYLPMQLLARFATANPAGPWQDIAANTAAMLTKTQPRQLAADWVVYDGEWGWAFDQNKGAQGSYDAIRVYLWAGMLHEAAPHREAILASTGGMRALLDGDDAPPEKIDAMTGEVEGQGPAGFSAALLPYLVSVGEHEAAAAQLQRIEHKSPTPLIGEGGHYYDQVLTLFGRAWYRGRFRFAADGSLEPAWLTCQKTLENASPR